MCLGERTQTTGGYHPVRTIILYSDVDTKAEEWHNRGGIGETLTIKPQNEKRLKRGLNAKDELFY